MRVERATLDADIRNRIGIGKTSVHLNLSGEGVQTETPPIWSIETRQSTELIAPSCPKHTAKNDPASRRIRAKFRLVIRATFTSMARDGKCGSSESAAQSRKAVLLGTKRS